MTDSSQDARRAAVSEWRSINAEHLLTAEDVAALPSGSVVEIVWSGGNGPHRYTIDQADWGTQWRAGIYSDEQWERVRLNQDPISFVGSEPFHTQIIRLRHIASYDC